MFSVSAGKLEMSTRRVDGMLKPKIVEHIEKRKFVCFCDHFLEVRWTYENQLRFSCQLMPFLSVQYHQHNPAASLKKVL